MNKRDKILQNIGIIMIAFAGALYSVDVIPIEWDFAISIFISVVAVIGGLLILWVRSKN